MGRGVISAPLLINQPPLQSMGFLVFAQEAGGGGSPCHGGSEVLCVSVSHTHLHFAPDLCRQEGRSSQHRASGLPLFSLPIW